MSLQLSVVIIGRNEGERLTRCIRSVQAMDFPKDEMEIIYVDSNSTDNSPQQAKALGVQVLVIQPDHPVAAFGRNAGWRAAQADFILFLDGDTVLQSDFVKVALPILKQDDNIIAVWGHRRELYPKASWYHRVLDLEWIYPPGPSDFFGGDVVVRRQVLAEVNGFNTEIAGGEEPELCQRIRSCGYTILHIDHPMTLHDLAITRWSQYWHRAVRTGHNFAEISTRFRYTAIPLWRQESRSNLFKSAILTGIVVIGIVISLGLKALWPLLLAVCLLLLLCLRTSWRARWKSNDLLTLLLYGFHSQFQHIPIAVGQILYYYRYWRRKRTDVITYK